MAFIFTAAFLGSVLLSSILTFFVRRGALAIGVLDVPNNERKIHAKPTPLLGGWAIFLSMAIIVSTLRFNTDLFQTIPDKYLIGMFFAGLVIMIGGTLDDKWNLRAKWQWMFPFLAGLIVVASGIGIDFITNPFGGVMRLDQWEISAFQIGNISYQVTVWADLFTILWLMGMAYTTKFLDGLDGLVSGIGVIASFIIFGISLLPEVSQSHTALLSLVLAGACFGFLFWNWNPAKIFLGEGGSLFIGFTLGILSIISGGKIATALLVMGIPILDVAWVIGRRLLIEKKSAFQADRKHLHFRLLDAGLTTRQAVSLFLGLTALFGSLAIILRGKDKILLLVAVVAAMIVLAAWTVKRYSRQNILQR